MTPSHEQDEIRLVAMTRADAYGIASMLADDDPNKVAFRQAWDSGIIEEEARVVMGDPEVTRDRDSFDHHFAAHASLLTKLHEAFQREPAS